MGVDDILNDYRLFIIAFLIIIILSASLFSAIITLYCSHTNMSMEKYVWFLAILMLLVIVLSLEIIEIYNDAIKIAKGGYSNDM